MICRVKTTSILYKNVFKKLKKFFYRKKKNRKIKSIKYKQKKQSFEIEIGIGIDE